MDKVSFCYMLENVMDEYLVFMELIKFLLKYNKTICISMWGNIDKNILDELNIFKASNRSFRSIISKEYNYLISYQDFDNFKVLADRINIKDISWGLALNGNAVVLAREKDDISICSCEFIPEKDFMDILEKFKIDAIIEKYEIIRDQENGE